MGAANGYDGDELDQEIGIGRPKESDLNSRAEIRNAALRLFAARGVAATSVRAVAKAARVSPGLVQHHFKTKRALQMAVEAHVAEIVARVGRAILAGGIKPGQRLIGRQIVQFIRENPDAIGYMRRVILENDGLGRRLFDQIVTAGHKLTERLLKEGHLRPDVDLTWANLNTILLVLGPLLLEAALDRHLDRPFRSEEGLTRWDLAVDEMLRQGVYRA